MHTHGLSESTYSWWFTIQNPSLAREVKLKAFWSYDIGHYNRKDVQSIDANRTVSVACFFYISSHYLSLQILSILTPSGRLYFYPLRVMFSPICTISVRKCSRKYRATRKTFQIINASR